MKNPIINEIPNSILSKFKISVSDLEDETCSISYEDFQKVFRKGENFTITNKSTIPLLYCAFNKCNFPADFFDKITCGTDAFVHLIKTLMEYDEIKATAQRNNLNQIKAQSFEIETLKNENQTLKNQIEALKNSNSEQDQTFEEKIKELEEEHASKILIIKADFSEKEKMLHQKIETLEDEKLSEIAKEQELSKAQEQFINDFQIENSQTIENLKKQISDLQAEKAAHPLNEFVEYTTDEKLNELGFMMKEENPELPFDEYLSKTQKLVLITTAIQQGFILHKEIFIKYRQLIVIPPKSS